ATCSSVRRFSFGRSIHSRMIFRRVSRSSMFAVPWAISSVTARRVRASPTAASPFLLRSFDLAGSLDRTTLGSAGCSRYQPFCQRRFSGLGAKLFQRDLPRLRRGLLSLDEIRLLKTSHLFSTLYFNLARGLPWLGGFS